MKYGKKLKRNLAYGLTMFAAVLIAGLIFTSIESSETPDKQTEAEVLSPEETEARRQKLRIKSTKNPWMPNSVSFAEQEIPLHNPIVKKKLEDHLRSLLQTRMDVTIKKSFTRSTYWFPLIERRAESINLHTDIKYLFVQESALDPMARSGANAMGICQFMSYTARGYGLRVDNHIDERLLPEKALNSCMQYLYDLKEDFDDIFLAVAAYNTGPTRVKNAILYDGSDSYFDLTHLPRETLLYAYKIVAWKLIFENPEKYGLAHRPKHADGSLPQILVTDTLLERHSHLRDISAHYRMDHERFQELNPHIKQQKLPGGSHSFRVPSGTAR